MNSTYQGLADLLFGRFAFDTFGAALTLLFMLFVIFGARRAQHDGATKTKTQPTERKVPVNMPPKLGSRGDEEIIRRGEPTDGW